MEGGLSSETQALVDKWLAWDKNEATRKQIRELVDAKNEKELKKILEKRIAFGTAGLRGRMFAGFANMNEVTVIQAAQGLCRYLEKVDPEIKKRGVVVGYDHRHNSQRFGELTAATFISQGIPVYLFRVLCATPFVPWCVLLKNCGAGVMITASHNPKDDNGYKVYWANGCQIIPPNDKGIALCIDENEKPWDGTYENVETLLKSPLLVDPTEEATNAYFETIKKYCWHREDNKNTKMKIVFTPMHGVGKPWAARSFEAFSLPHYIPVPLQIEADPDFPTVSFPNPEEGKGALKLAIETAEQHGSSLILAHDPDSDRLAAAEKLRSGEWKIFTGNEIGILLAWWVWDQYRAQHPDADPSKCVMLNTTVSSKMLSAMAKKEGFKYDETLTGFKWLGNLALKYIAEGYNFLYGFEEAIGYMVGDVSLDKDSVRCISIFAEMAIHLDNQGKTVNDKLEELYLTYGFYATQNKYFFCYDPVTLDKIFAAIRNGGNYHPTAGKHKIKNIRDLTTGYDNTQPDNKAILPTSSSTHMITFYFENGSIVTLRGSGTEPKLKYYTELPGVATNESEKAAIRAELNDVVQGIIHDFLRPEFYGLEPPTD